MTYDLVIRGGTVATASDVVRCDVGIRQGIVAALGANLPQGRTEIDASGQYVLPGGVDSHCHIEQPGSVGGQNADTFVTGTVSAACGGTTTVICFSPQKRGGSVAEAAENYHRIASKSVIDYSFHIVVNDPSEQVLQELPRLIEQGHRPLKIFMTYDSNFVDDGQVLKVLELARHNQALVCVHAENHEAIKWMTARLLDAGLTHPRYHAWSKPPVVEREAVHRVIALAEMVDQPIQIFHVTCGEAAEEIRRAQERGLKIFGETCAQYFVLTDRDMDRDGFEGAKYICSPSPRDAREHEALWRYVRGGTLDIVTSDHAPYMYEGTTGKRVRGDNAPFNIIPNGVPGVETRLPIVFSEGVAGGRIGLTTFVAITSTIEA